MPTPCYISIKGAAQGLITAGANMADSVGDAYVEGHEDEMMVQAFSHDVTVSTDPQSGQPSGQRTHKPFKFTVSLNKAVPLLYNALASGEYLSEVTLRWYRTSRFGYQENFFTTKLYSAVVTNIECEMPHCQDPENASFTQNLTVSIAYRGIRWEHLNSGTLGSDDWRKPLEQID